MQEEEDDRYAFNRVSLRVVRVNRRLTRKPHANTSVPRYTMYQMLCLAGGDGVMVDATGVSNESHDIYTYIHIYT